MFSQCVLKIPQYIQYSGIFETFVRTKSLTQKRKKQFLEVACLFGLPAEILQLRDLCREPWKSSFSEVFAALRGCF